MESYLLKIYSNEDFDLIEDEEEREEAQETFENEIEAVYQYLKKNNIEFEQIDDTRFSVNCNNDEIFEEIEQMLEIEDIAFCTIENYKDI